MLGTAKQTNKKHSLRELLQNKKYVPLKLGSVGVKLRTRVWNEVGLSLNPSSTMVDLVVVT